MSAACSTSAPLPASGVQVVFLDEPVNGLDPEGVQWVRQLVRALAAEGRTVFLSSHLMSEMYQTADHLLGRQQRPLPPPRRVGELHLYPSHRGVDARRGSTAVIRVIPPPRAPAPMAHRRWQKPADGSDTLAMAQIRWQRTFIP